MTINQIREVNLYELIESRNLEKPKELAPKGRKCIYDTAQACTVPECKQKICEKCPFGMMYTEKQMRRNIFDKIIGMAIFMLGQRPFSIRAAAKGSSTGAAKSSTSSSK